MPPQAATIMWLHAIVGLGDSNINVGGGDNTSSGGRGWIGRVVGEGGS